MKIITLLLFVMLCLTGCGGGGGSGSDSVNGLSVPGQIEIVP